MASPVIMGLETEYGIVQLGSQDQNPVLSSSILVNAYVRATSGGIAEPAVGWDFEDESPAVDARGQAPVGSMPPAVETHLVNAVLTNGARYYVDHAHPEISTPECADPLTLVVQDRAAEVIIQRSMDAANTLVGDGSEFVIHKNNSDGKGNSYGCHENYLVARSVPFGRIVGAVLPHFVTRQIYCGAGKVGHEVVPGPAGGGFQMSQRADFFEEEVGLETTLKRPIVNTRDEPHADPTVYRRLHVIVGDANRSETATLLKLGTTALVLAMLEDDCLGDPMHLATPVPALRTVSRDLGLTAPLELADGTTITALEIQRDLHARACRYGNDRGVTALGSPELTAMVLDEWGDLLDCLERDRDRAADRIDWIAKFRLLDAYRERNELGWDHPRLAAIDLQYHDLRPNRDISRRVGLRRLTDPEAIERAVTDPPTDTRAYFRGTCLSRFPESIVAANWDSLVFDLGEAALRRIPTTDPARGTRRHVGELLDRSETVGELLDAIEA